MRSDSKGSIGLAAWVLFLCVGVLSGQVITTVAGTNWVFPPTPLPASSAPLSPSLGVAADPNGGVYIADGANNMVFRRAPDGTLSLIAGNGTRGFSGDGGSATSASLSFPEGVAADSTGNLYIADTSNNRIRKVSGGIITTVAGNGTYGFAGDGGPSASASFSYPAGVAVDSAGTLYIADSNGQRVRKVSGGIITTVAGNGTYGYSGDGGPATSAQLFDPSGVAVDSAGNIYIADSSNFRVRKLSAGVITTLAGNGAPGFSGDGGPAASATLGHAAGVAVDSAGNVYIADADNNRIRKVSGGIITTVAGNGTMGFSGDGAPATSASLSSPIGVSVDGAGDLFIADAGNSRVRQAARR